MTSPAANAVLDRLEADDAFAERVKSAGEAEGPETALVVLMSAGFDVTQQEMRDAFLDRYGDQLTPEQLEAVTGGWDGPGVAAIITISVFAAAVSAAV